MLASHITTHARQVVMGLGRSNVWRHAFAIQSSPFLTLIIADTDIFCESLSSQGH